MHKDDETITLDLSKITDLFKKKPKAKENNSDETTTVIEKDQKIIHKKNEDSSEADESLKLDGIVNSFRKNLKYIIPLILMLIAMFFSVYFRLSSAYLPVTDTWATNSIYSYYRNQIQAQINQQYPNLPDENRASLAEKEFQKFLSSNKEMIEEQIKATSKQFKSNFQYTAENGKDYMYLSDIDTWLWYGETRNYIRYGHFGTKVVNGHDINFLRNGRFGLEMPNIELHSLFGVYLYKLVHIFSNVPLMAVFFFISPIVIALSIIPAFFIGRRLGGNICGFFAAMIVAINTSVLVRTPASVADTDPWNIFFPLMIIWFFLEAFEAKKLKKQIIYAVLSGLCVGLFSYAWGGWWFVFDFILATLGLYIGYLIIKMVKESEKSIAQFKSLAIVIGSFFIASAVFVTLFQDFNTFLGSFTDPLSIITLKDVGVTSLWPNVLTTVAEFNVVPLSAITAQMGENLLFWIGLMGIVLLMVNRKKLNEINVLYILVSGIYYLIVLAMENVLNEPIKFMVLISIPVILGFMKIIYFKEYEIDVKLALLMTIWFLGTGYGFTKGIRFGILMVPAFAISFGYAISFTYNYASKLLARTINLNKNIGKAIVAFLLLLLLINPIKAANAVSKNEMILMNDAWYDSLIGIKNDCDDGIITSWWDFGHWFVSIAERRVTFDGADQGERIHWVGKSLLTDDEEAAIGLLRMLNCGQELAPHVLEKYVNGDTVRAVDILNKIIVQDKKTAAATLKKEGLSNAAIQDVLNVTHCDNLIKQYFIASDDMIGKAGVWAHFGSWDFKRAKMWNKVNGKTLEEGIRILQEEFNMSYTQAETIASEILSTPGDQWIAPWPSYMSELTGCGIAENILTCGNGLKVNLTDMSAYIMSQQGEFKIATLAYVDNKTKEFRLNNYSDAVAPYGAALIPTGGGYNSILMAPELAGSMFTKLFFYNGHGLKHFSLLSDKMPLTGGKIQVWRVNLEHGESINNLN